MLASACSMRSCPVKGHTRLRRSGHERHSPWGSAALQRCVQRAPPSHLQHSRLVVLLSPLQANRLLAWPAGTISQQLVHLNKGTGGRAPRGEGRL